MKHRPSPFVLWLCSLVITLGLVYYQRATGPTHPMSGSVRVGAELISYELPRTHAGDGDSPIEIVTRDTLISGQLSYRRFKSHDRWTTVDMHRHNGALSAALPHQSPAGKIMYQVILQPLRGAAVEMVEEPVIIRFRGDVPTAVLTIHIILTFAAMLLSTRAGLEAVYRRERVNALVLWTTVTLLVGGLCLGPIVQRYAFGSLWTGWPFGHDLTDNKTAVAFLVWLVALWRIRIGKAKNAPAVIASLVMLIVFLIPHSLLGSEIDYTQSVSGIGPPPG